MKKLTIGITTYNSMPFILEMLDGIANDIKKNEKIKNYIDFYLYDDCSTDNTIEIANRYKDFLNIKIAEVNHGGPAKGRNYILNNCQSEFVLFIDGDDKFICPLLDIVKFLDFQDSDIIVTKPKIINLSGNQVERKVMYQKKLFSLPYEDIEKNAYKYVVHQMGLWNIFNVNFINENNLRFKEDMRHEDSFFLTQYYLRNPRIGLMKKFSYYGWRSNQNGFTRSKKVVKQRVELYELILKEIELIGSDNKYAPYLIFSIYNRSFYAMQRNFPILNTNERKEYFRMLKAVEKPYNKLINEIKAKQGNVSRIFRLSRYPIFHTFFVYSTAHKIKSSKKLIKKSRNQFLPAFMQFLPIDKKKIVILNFNGTIFNDNGKYLYKKLKADNKYKDHKIIVPVRRNSQIENNDFVHMKDKWKYMYHLYTASHVYNNTWSIDLPKRKGQKWTLMWHGIPHKKVDKDIVVYNETWSEITKNNMNNFKDKIDEVYSLNAYNTKIFNEIFAPEKVVEKNYPKVEWLEDNINNEQLKKSIYNKYEIYQGKYVLYAPTYRPYEYEFDIKEVLKLIEEDEKLIISIHNRGNEIDLKGYEDKIIHLDDYDIQEIALISQSLITDYSSLAYDFIKMNKKVKYYQPDYEMYNLLHGLYVENLDFLVND